MRIGDCGPGTIVRMLDGPKKGLMAVVAMHNRGTTGIEGILPVTINKHDRQLEANTIPANVSVNTTVLVLQTPQQAAVQSIQARMVLGELLNALMYYDMNEEPIEDKATTAARTIGQRWISSIAFIEQAREEDHDDNTRTDITSGE